MSALIAAAFLVSGCQRSLGTFTVSDLGKEYSFPTDKLVEGLYHHIAIDDDVIGGNTSIRNMPAEGLKWKGNPNGNGYGYFQRNRDLGQVFTVPAGQDILLDALVLRTSRGNNAIMPGAAGAELNIVFFEVVPKPGQQIRINENGTGVGQRATHGFDLQFNRADDYLEGADYKFLHHSTGGVFPDVPPTTQLVYDNGKGGPFGEQAGHLRYFRCAFATDSKIKLKAGKTYAFMIGFTHPGVGQGLALAIDSEVHTKAKAEFVRDANGQVRWGIRREGNGSKPPTMIAQSQPPTDEKVLQPLLQEALFPTDHYTTLPPTTDGYPDVDTYRTLQFYLEIRQE